MDSQKRWVLAAVDVYFRDHMGLLLIHCSYMKTQGVEQNDLRIFLIFNLFKDFYLFERQMDRVRRKQRETDLFDVLPSTYHPKLATIMRFYSGRNQDNRTP